MALLTAIELTKDTISADVTPASVGTAFTSASSHTFYLRKEGRQLLVINNTYAGSLVVTVAAGGYLAAGKGTTTLTVAQSCTGIVDLSSDRFKAQGTGTDATGTDVPGVVTITFSASGTGFVLVISLP